MRHRVAGLASRLANPVQHSPGIGETQSRPALQPKSHQDTSVLFMVSGLRFIRVAQEDIDAMCTVYNRFWIFLH